MAWKLDTHQLANPDGTPRDRWRRAWTRDDGPGIVQCCLCPGGHESPSEAESCPVARSAPEPR